MVIHAVPGTICRQYVAVVMSRAGTVALVYKHTIESISMLINGVLRRDMASVAYIRLNIEHLGKHDMTSYLSSHHSIPIHMHTKQISSSSSFLACNSKIA